MPTRKQIRRRRAVALGLIALCILSLTVYFSETTGGVLHTMQRGAMEVLSPLQSLASGAIKPARDAVNWVGDSFEAKGDNKKLEAELKDARIRQARLEQAAAENEELRGLLDFRRSDAFPEGRKAVTARVIVRSPSDWFGRVTINAGSSDGVRRNDPVIAGGDNGGSLIGKVTTVAGNSSQVTLLTDSVSGVAAMISGKNILGVIKPASGASSADELQLQYIRQRGTIKEGEMVVTSGTVTDPSDVDSLFPAGIPIGEISEVDGEERRLYGRVDVSPYADIHDVQVVDVLTRGRR